LTWAGVPWNEVKQPGRFRLTFENFR
jgi:hypothetical protein